MSGARVTITHEGCTNVTLAGALITTGSGGAAIANAVLIDWTLSEAWSGTITLDGDGVPDTGNIIWPDGSLGTWTRTSKDATWGGVEAFTVTHADSGKTVTQTAVTRDGTTGAITNVPTPTVT